MNVICMGFPGSSCNVGDPGSVPGLGSSPGEGIGYPLQYSWAFLVAQMVKNLPAMSGDLGLIPGLGKSPWRRARLPTPVFLGFPGGSAGKGSACNVGDLGLSPGLEKGKATYSSILAWRIPWTV